MACQMINTFKSEQTAREDSGNSLQNTRDGYKCTSSCQAAGTVRGFKQSVIRIVHSAGLLNLVQVEEF